MGHTKVRCKEPLVGDQAADEYNGKGDNSGYGATDATSEVIPSGDGDSWDAGKGVAASNGDSWASNAPAPVAAKDDDDW